MYLFATINKLKIAIIKIKIDILQHNRNIKAKMLRTKPLITVTGIALKGQADIISIMVPLEVLVQQRKMKKDNRKVL